MRIDIVTLQGELLLDSDAKERIMYLLAQFSEKHSQLIKHGELDVLYEETANSPNTYICVGIDQDSWRDAGMYVATVKPALLSKNLYIDAVVVDESFRGQGVLKFWLVPHMIRLAKRLGCARVELTSSRPAAQKAYALNGFLSQTTAFRLAV